MTSTLGAPDRSAELDILSTHLTGLETVVTHLQELVGGLGSGGSGSGSGSGPSPIASEVRRSLIGTLNAAQNQDDAIVRLNTLNYSHTVGASLPFTYSDVTGRFTFNRACTIKVVTSIGYSKTNSFETFQCRFAGTIIITGTSNTGSRVNEITINATAGQLSHLYFETSRTEGAKTAILERATVTLTVMAEN